MTKKDYIAIANAFKDANRANKGCDERLWGISQAIHNVALVMRDDNPRFDMAKFKEACKCD